MSYCLPLGSLMFVGRNFGYFRAFQDKIERMIPQIDPDRKTPG